MLAAEHHDVIRKEAAASGQHWPRTCYPEMSLPRMEVLPERRRRSQRLQPIWAGADRTELGWRSFKRPDHPLPAARTNRRIYRRIALEVPKGLPPAGAVSSW